jgi:type I restriction enzyme R subunit
MSLNESTVEDTALEWFGELGYAVGQGPHPASGEPASRDGGRDSFSEVVLVGRLREAIRRLNPAIPQARTLATLRDTLLPKLLRRELSMAKTVLYPANE